MTIINYNSNTPAIEFSKEHPVAAKQLEFIDLVTLISQNKFSFEAELQEIHDLNFRLDVEPESNVGDFNLLYAQVQAAHSRVTSIIVKMRDVLGTWKDLKYQADRLYKRSSNSILTTDVRVKNLRNQTLQQAAIDDMLADIVDIVELVNSEIDRLKHDISTAELKLGNIETANVNLNRQQKIVELMVGLQHTVYFNRREVKLNPSL